MMSHINIQPNCKYKLEVQLKTMPVKQYLLITVGEQLHASSWDSGNGKGLDSLEIKNQGQECP